MSSKKKVRLGNIDIDKEQFVLIVNYSTETHHLDATGGTMHVDSQQSQKTIRVSRGLERGAIPHLAQEVVDKCKYIHASKVGEVERLLCQLMEHEAFLAGAGGGHRSNGPEPPPGPPPPPAPPSHMHHQAAAGPPPSSHGRYQPPPAPQPPKPAKRQEPLLPSADVRLLEEYADQLYEDKMELKVHGAKCILRICTEPTNLEFVGEHDTLLGVLSRELRENSKKSFELSVAIVCTCLCFSHFSDFHQCLMNHQCGDVTMRVLEYESQRHSVRKQEMEAKLNSMAALGDKASGEDRRQLAKDEKKYRIQLNRQNKLIHVCVSALLNLAEGISIEKKMVNRKMPLLLVQLLDRTHEDLLMVALQFLKKLSVFEVNKETMNTPETLSALVRLAQHPNVRVALLSLHLLFNLSFDENVRASLVESGIVKLLVDLLRKPPFRHIVLRLLYHFSMDDRCKSLMLYYQDGMTMLLQLVVHFPEQRVGKDLVALVVNLATHPRAAEVMMHSGLFPQVMLRVLKTRDPLLCKVIRHVFSHKEVLEPMFELLASESVRMSKWMHEFVRMALCGVDSPDLLVEVLGTLANVTLPDISWSELCEAGLIDLLHRLLVPGFSEDDVVLECVMIVGNLGLCRESCEHISRSRLPSMLQEILLEKRDDEEIVLQLLFTFHCLLVHDETREVILQDTEIAQYVMKFARSKNPAIIEQATKTLEVVADYAGDSADQVLEQIKGFRFEQHNAEWTQCVNRELNGGVGASPMAFYDDMGPDSAGDEEEEFAFHWAGGDAADAQDLANRDWGNKDMESFMHTSRFVS
eukprot:TRINITY_DN12232_c0_g3_i1.p1 TRINITY_DN12232_c0_g3~~TRINITY_DN12232_c0_g3_i1.p1  ORF type:complete len:806 (-),score=209.42 TRINITY_DN12232_c0_g3_i1:268-2685(-)